MAPSNTNLMSFDSYHKDFLQGRNRMIRGLGTHFTLNFMNLSQLLPLKLSSPQSLSDEINGDGDCNSSYNTTIVELISHKEALINSFGAQESATIEVCLAYVKAIISRDASFVGFSPLKFNFLNGDHVGFLLGLNKMTSVLN